MAVAVDEIHKLALNVTVSVQEEMRQRNERRNARKRAASTSPARKANRRP